MFVLCCRLSHVPAALAPEMSAPVCARLSVCPPSSVRYTYIADGHHRSASAFRVGEMKIKAAIAEGHNVSGDEPFCYFLAVLFPANQYVPLETKHPGEYY